MQSKPDAQLLREYADSGSESAFAELVTRHTDLVYSTALRQMSSSDLACDVAQNVFTSLACDARALAGKLNPDASLAGWLCRCTRNLALNLRRDDFRRHSRERQVMETLHPSPETTPDWDRLSPLLDQAISGLNETDHDALVLRFFKNQDLRSVGLALGVSDDTAQKRVSRALEKLREHLVHHGITTTGAALAMAISANAVQAAPVGLAATISAAAVLAGTAIHTSTVLAATKTIAMTALQKNLIVATIAVVAGTGIYEAHQASRLRSQNELLQKQQAPLAEQIRQLQHERDGTKLQLAALQAENEQLKSNQNTAELLKLRGETTRLRNNANDPAESAVKASLAKVNLLKQRLEQTPGAKIPEFQFLTEEDWLNAVKDGLNIDEDYRQAFSALRNAAEQNFRPMIQSALRQYIQANNGQFPTDLSQLQSYFNLPVDAAILQRWQILPAADFPNTSVGADWVVTQKAAVDDKYDECLVLGPDGGGGFNSGFEESLRTLVPALQAYSAANNGQTFSLVNQTGLADLSPLTPYLQTPEQQAAVQKLLQLKKRYIEGK
jgi:RNA polymerase sigma factor (sigma-70 family)